MKRINPNHRDCVVAAINKTPYLELLKASVTELDRGHCKVEIELDATHMNTMGHTHGGLYASLIDAAAAWALYFDIEENAGFTTIDLHVDDLARTTRGPLTCVGKPIKVGATICLAEAVITREDGKQVAYGTSKCFVSAALPNTIEDLGTLLGHPLPNKFLPFE